MSSNRQPDSSFAPADKGQSADSMLNTLTTTQLEDSNSEELENNCSLEIVQCVCANH